MTNPINYASGLEPRRSGGLIAFGVISIVIGALSGCLALVTPLSMLAPPGVTGNASQQWRTLAPAIVIYVLVSVSFIWIGIDSIRHRRWVRPVVLGLMWPWLVMGILSSVIWVFVLPRMGAIMAGTMSTGAPPGAPAAPALPPGVITLMLVMMAVSFLFIYIVVPGAYVLFYRREAVRTVLDANDPGPAWTDAAPMPVLGLSLWMALAAVSMFMMLMRAAMPFFGIVLTGFAGSATGLMVSVVLLFGAYAAYRRRAIAWWIAIAVAVFMPLSLAVTVFRMGAANIYRAANYSEMEIERIAQITEGRTVFVATAILGFALPAIGYLIYLRRFFREPDAGEARGLQPTMLDAKEPT